MTGRRTPFQTVALASLACLAASVSGCSLGDGASKSGGPSPSTDADRPITLRFASGDPSVTTMTFVRELARISGGRLRAVLERYDDDATDTDQQIARDLAAGRLDVADVAARAWESQRATAFRALQSPFLITSDELLDRVVSDRRISDPLLRSLQSLDVTGLALTPRGVRYLFATERPLDRPNAFRGARIRVNQSPTTNDIVTALHARPDTAVRSGRDVVNALRTGRLDAVEADMRLAAFSGYARGAPHVAAALFPKVTALVANTNRLTQLGSQATDWIREAAQRAAEAERARDHRSAWSAACGGGLKPVNPSPAQLDALHAAQLDTYSQLDGDVHAAVVIDRIGLLATESARVDPWARCNNNAPIRSQTKVIDGTYEVTITQADLDRTGTEPGNDGDYRIHIGNGRYAILHMRDAVDPEWPGWDFKRDPVEVGSVLLKGDRALFRPETSIAVGGTPNTYRFELFRDRLRWRHVSGPDDFVLYTRHPWRKVE